MNSLITSTKPITSMQIAEITKKQHQHIMRDIRDEIEKLSFAGISTESKFGLSERTDSTGRKIPYYELTKEGVLQLAARYDAVTRAKLINLAMKNDAPKPVTALEALRQTVQALTEQAQRIDKVEATQQAIKDAVIAEPDNWRRDIYHKMNRIAKSIGTDKFKDVRTESYKLLDERAHADLNRRLFNYRARLLAQGQSKTVIDKANVMDIIDQDPKLREIYGKIVSEYLIKYVA